MSLMRGFLVVFIGMAAWSMISPRSQWELLASWQYKQPEAQEPSNAAYLLARFVGAFGIIFAVWVWIQLGHMSDV